MTARPWRIWSAEEDATLRKLPSREAAEMLSRTWAQVKCRLQVLRLRVLRRCPVCASVFPVTGSRDKICPVCRAEKKRPDGRASICGVCGNSFWGLGKRCGNGCASKEDGALGIRVLSPSGKTRLVEARRRNLRALEEGLRASPLTGDFPTHHSALEWFLRAPDGRTHKVRNLAHFTRHHPEWFGETRLQQKRAAKALGSLRPTRAVVREDWEGWTWVSE